jgi:signal transduction histidine kinase
VSDDGDWRLWDLYFAVAFTVVFAFVLLVDQGEPVAERVAVSLLVAGMAAWYIGFGRRLVRCGIEDGRNIVFQAGIVALYLPAIFLIESTSFVLFALCPLAYMSLPMIPASAVVVVTSLALPATVLAKTGDLRATLAVPLPMALVIIAFSTVIAVTISRTERRSAERAVLIEELDSTRAEVARLSREAGVAEERQRLAGEIHDTVAQGLSSVVMLVQAADAALGTDPEAARAHLALAARTARENLDEARAMVGALTPAPLTQASLVDAITRLAERFTGETGIPARVTVDGGARALPTGVEVVLLRVAQEALTNVRKHAGALDVDVRVVFTDGGASVKVRDDGCGFEVDGTSTGYGLEAMRGRVEQVGGRFSIRSSVGQGTAIEAEIDT